MVISNLNNKSVAQKIRYTLHLAGLGFFLKWVSQIGLIYFFVIIPLLIFVQYRFSKTSIDGFKNFWRDTILIILVFGYGVGSLWNFVGHMFMTHEVAEAIGWERSPFQIELAGYHLAFSLMCLLTLWNRNVGYFGAVVHAMGIFLFTAGGVHIYEMLANQNYNDGNASVPILIGTTFYPAVVIILYWKYFNEMKHIKQSQSDRV